LVAAPSGPSSPTTTIHPSTAIHPTTNPGARCTAGDRASAVEQSPTAPSRLPQIATGTCQGGLVTLPARRHRSHQLLPGMHVILLAGLTCRLLLRGRRIITTHQLPAESVHSCRCGLINCDQPPLVCRPQSSTSRRDDHNASMWTWRLLLPAHRAAADATLPHTPALAAPSTCRTQNKQQQQQQQHGRVRTKRTASVR
jgi:hypothetical protein